MQYGSIFILFRSSQIASRVFFPMDGWRRFLQKLLLQCHIAKNNITVLSVADTCLISCRSYLDFISPVHLASEHLAASAPP